MSRHNKGDLQQMQSLPLEAKILMTQRRIRDWVDYWNGDVYVSFSGGKDSTVLKHIVDGMYDNIPSVFVNTGLEYPEIQQFVREIKTGKYDCFNSDVEIIRPEMRFDEVIKQYGYPVISKEVARAVHYARKENTKSSIYYMQKFNGELMYEGKKSPYNHKKWKFLLEAPFLISSFCCDVMKKKPAKSYGKQTGRKPFIATMAGESRLREQKWIQNGCNAFHNNNPISQPMAFWTEQDVLHYIKQYGVPYCPVYGDIQVKNSSANDQIKGQINLIDYLGCYEQEDTLETTGCNRTGCMFCMFGCHLEKEPNRFQRMKQTHPKQYEYCMDKLGLKEVLEYIGVPYE